MKILRRHAKENGHYKDQSLRRKQGTNTSNDRRLVSRVPHGLKMWRRKSNYKDSEETQISNISEFSKYDEHNSDINISGIHYVGNQDEYAKEYNDEDENEGDEEGYSDDYGILF